MKTNPVLCQFISSEDFHHFFSRNVLKTTSQKLPALNTPLVNKLLHLRSSCWFLLVLISLLKSQSRVAVWPSSVRSKKGKVSWGLSGSFSPVA